MIYIINYLFIKNNGELKYCCRWHNKIFCNAVIFLDHDEILLCYFSMKFVRFNYVWLHQDLLVKEHVDNTFLKHF